MQKLKRLLFALAVIVLVVIGGVYSGLYNVAATQPDGPLRTWLMHTTMERSVRFHARDITVPELDRRELVLAGVSDFNSMCAGCHGEPWGERGFVGQGLNPLPPEPAELAEDWNAAQQFWIVMHGVRMTGMPAFGRTHEPGEIWPVVAFLEALPGMDRAGYRELKEAAEGYGHHAHDGGHHDHDHDSAHADSDHGHMDESHEHTGDHPAGDMDAGPIQPHMEAHGDHDHDH